tara:strand:- start:17 stop:556 length:540 start_codon:yes stop_codon:yes gene_type:complete
VKNRVNKFKDYEKLFEAEAEDSKAPLRGYTASVMVSRIEQLMEVMPDRIKFGVPADIKGYSTSYRDANGAIQKIMDISHYYSGKGEEVTYYCWNISYSGSWDATKGLRSKIDEFGGFGREQNMNLKKVVEYFKDNTEDADNVRSLSISIDTMSIRKAANKQSEAEETPQSEEPMDDSKV